MNRDAMSERIWRTIAIAGAEVPFPALLRCLDPRWMDREDAA